MAKTMREYQRDWRERHLPSKKDGTPRRSIKTDMSVLLGYAAGEISEGRAAKALGVDRIELRSRKNEAIATARRVCDVSVLNGLP